MPSTKKRTTGISPTYEPDFPDTLPHQPRFVTQHGIALKSGYAIVLPGSTHEDVCTKYKRLTEGTQFVSVKQFMVQGNHEQKERLRKALKYLVHSEANCRVEGLSIAVATDTSYTFQGIKLGRFVGAMIPDADDELAAAPAPAGAGAAAPASTGEALANAKALTRLQINVYRLLDQSWYEKNKRQSTDLLKKIEELDLEELGLELSRKESLKNLVVQAGKNPGHYLYKLNKDRTVFTNVRLPNPPLQPTLVPKFGQQNNSIDKPWYKAAQDLEVAPNLAMIIRFKIDATSDQGNDARRQLVTAPADQEVVKKLLGLHETMVGRVTAGDIKNILDNINLQDVSTEMRQVVEDLRHVLRIFENARNGVGAR